MNKLKSLIESGLVDREDGTILDTRTNLLWQKETSNKAYTWEETKQYCKKLTLARHRDWRLPTIEELKTLINKKYSPTIDPIFECKTYWYWSLPTYVDIPVFAWHVNFSDGYTSNIDTRDSHYYVRVVCGV